MKRRKRLCALLLAGLLLLALAGCGQPAGAELARGLRRLALAESYRIGMALSLRTEGQAGALELGLDMDAYPRQAAARVGGFYVREPSGARQALDLEMYLHAPGGVQAGYIRLGGMGWLRAEAQAAPASKAARRAAALPAVDLLLACAPGFVEAGPEDVGGAPAVRWDGAIPAEAVNERLAAAFAAASAAAGAARLPEDPPQTAGDLAVSVWLAEDGGRPLRIRVEATPLFRAVCAWLWEGLAAVLPGDAGAPPEAFDAAELTVTLELRDYGALPGFSLPDAAREAPELLDHLLGLPAAVA